MGSTPKVIQHAIITYARSWSALAATRSLGKRGVRVFAGDVAKHGAATYSKYCFKGFVYPDPGKEKEFVNCLIDKCKEIREKYGGEILLLPIHEESYVIAKNIKKFPSYVNFVSSDFGILNKVQNKGELIPLANGARVKIPKSFYVRTVKGVNEKVREIGYPFYLKKLEGAGSTGIWRIENSESLDKVARKVMPPFVMQEFIPGKDYCCCALMDNGRKIALMTYTALQTYPVRGGTSVYRKNVLMPEIEEEALKLLKKLKWHGVAELDFRVDERTGKPVLIEVNPRFWGGLNQSISSNLDFPYLVWRMAEGHRLEEIKKINNNVTTRNFAGALVATITEMLELKSPKTHFSKALRRPTPKNIWTAFRSVRDSFKFHKKYLTKRFLSKKSVDDIYRKDDPNAMAGILFPLDLYRRYGKIDSKMLISSSPGKR